MRGIWFRVCDKNRPREAALFALEAKGRPVARAARIQQKIPANAYGW